MISDQLLRGETITVFTFYGVFISLLVGGASFADMGEAFDEILSFSIAEGGEETKEVFSVQSHKDAVISCCWLHIKARVSFVFDCCCYTSLKVDFFFYLTPHVGSLCVCFVLFF